MDDLGLRNVIDELVYSQKTPLIFDVLKIMKKEPKLLEKPTIAERIIEKIRKFVEIFIDGVD